MKSIQAIPFSASYKFERGCYLKQINNIKQNSFITVKNRYETFQLLIYSPFDCTFNVDVTDLVDANGNVISKDNIRVYNEGFISVKSNFHSNGFLLGDYPDVLFPIEKVVENGDNFLTKNLPNILFIEIFIPEDCKASNYCGKIVVNKSTQVQYFVEVLDVILPSEVTHKSMFCANSDCIKLFEKQFSQDEYDKYVQMLIDHRLGPTELVPEFKTDDEFINDYADKIYRWVVNNKMSYSNIPSVLLQGVKPKSFDPYFFKKYLIAILEKSIQKSVDLFKHLGFYNWCIDEPFCWDDNDGRVYRELNKYEIALNGVYERYLNDSRLKNSFGKELLKSFKNISHIITDFYERDDYEPKHEKFLSDGTKFYYDVKKVSLCPKYDGLATAKRRALYKGGEKWWYNCGTPNSPYPAYHIDESAFAPRLLAWMMQDYNIIGNLYWSVTASIEMFEDGTSSYVKQPYSLRRGYGSNGEGILIYPGFPYGADNPIASLRLKSIRSGYEDYELIGQLRTCYKSLHISSKSLMKRLFLPLYYNAKIDDCRSEYFDQSLKTLYGAILLAQKHGITIESEKISGKLLIKLKGSLSSATLNGEQFKKDGYSYSCAVDYSEEFANLSVFINGKQEDLPIYIGKGMTIFTENDWLKLFKIVGDVTIEKIIQEGINRINVTPRSGCFEIQIPKRFLKANKKVSFTLLSTTTGNFVLKSSQKLLASGEFESPDNKIMGTVRRIDLLTSDLQNGKIQINLQDLKTIGLRDFYFC